MFSARGCNLSGPLPASWAGLPALGVLDMAYNYFTGEELSLASHIVCMLKLCSAALCLRQLGRHASFTSPACWQHDVLLHVWLFCHSLSLCVALQGRSQSHHLGLILCHLVPPSYEAGSDTSVSALLKFGAWPTAGSLPVEWQGMGALQALDLVGNGLTGTLPDGYVTLPASGPCPAYSSAKLELALACLMQTGPLHMSAAAPDYGAATDLQVHIKPASSTLLTLDCR